VQTSLRARLHDDLRRVPAWAWDVVLAITALAMVVSSGAATKTDWSYYDAGQRLLFGDDGLRIYALHPVYQIGPLGLGLAKVIAAVPGDGRLWDAAVLSALLVPVLALTRRLVSIARPEGLATSTYVLGWLVIGFGWFPLVAIGQLGDALALLGALGAMLLLVRHRPELAGVAFGLGCAAKPWILVLLPLLLFARSRDLVRAVAAATVVGVLTWGPFVLAAPGTLRAARPTFFVPTNDWQRLAGVGDGAPSWWRTAQLLVCWGVGLAMWARTRGEPDQLVGLLATAGVLSLVRLLTDLGTWPYYVTVALPLVLLADVATRARRVPWPTLVAFLPILALGALMGDVGEAAYRVLSLLVALVLLGRAWWVTTSPVAGTGRGGGRIVPEGSASGSP